MRPPLCDGEMELRGPVLFDTRRFNKVKGEMRGAHTISGAVEDCG